MRYIYCHPLFDERKCAHRFSYQLAQVFENNNLRLERFDYRGTGESEDEFCDVTIDSLRADIQGIINNEHVCLIGTRLGAAIAFDYCCRSASNVQMLVMIEPIVNGQSYVEYLFRKQHLKNIMTGNNSECTDEICFHNIEGYKTSRVFIEQLRQFNLNKIMYNINVNTVSIIQISAYSKIDSEYDMLAKHLKDNRIKSRVEVIKISAFWERIPQKDYSILTNKIVGWFK